MTRVLPVDEAVALVRPVDTLGFGLGPDNPDTFLTALGAREDWEDLQVGGALCLNYYEVFTKPGVSYRCGFFGPAERLLHGEGFQVELVPGGFRQFAQRLPVGNRRRTLQGPGPMVASAASARQPVCRP